MNPLLSRFFLFSGLVLAMACQSANVGQSPEFIHDGKSTVPAGTESYTYYEQQTLQYDDRVYRPTIHTPLLYKTGFELNPPLIALHSGETVTLTFDDFDPYIKDLYYTVIHCDAEWKPSGLMEAEYLKGFFSYNITQYGFSFNTLLPYVNYKLVFPNENMQVTRSGNYLLKVFANNNPEEVLLTRRFMVYEGGAVIDARFKRPANVEERFTHQAFDLNINVGSLNPPNPFTDIKVIIQQNNRWDNAMTGFQPNFVRDQELIYHLDSPYTFPGGNEFRFFDLKSLTYLTPNVARIIRDSVPWNVLLLNEEKRSYKKYITSYDINGKFLIKNDLAYNPDTESDYVYVYFYLPMDEPVIEGNIYVFGALSDWRVKDDFRLTYNYRTGRYETRILLKQGYYNYEYVLVTDKSNVADETFIEGSHFDTENSYTVLVYFRDVRLHSDRLVGVRQLNTQHSE